MKQQSLVNTEYISPDDCGLFSPYWISSICISNISYLRTYWISARRELGCSRRGTCVIIINNSQIFQLQLRVSYLDNVLCKHVDKSVPSLTHASSMPICLIINKNANPISATPGFNPTTTRIGLYISYIYQKCTLDPFKVKTGRKTLFGKETTGSRCPNAGL